MPSTLFDLSVTVASPTRSSGLSDRGKSALFTKPVFTNVKDRVGGIRAQGPEPPATEDDELSFEDLEEDYEEVVTRAKGLLELLKEQVGPMIFEFDPAERPELAEAVSKVFQGEYRKITFDMYLAALQLDKDVATQIGEQSHGV